MLSDLFRPEPGSLLASVDPWVLLAVAGTAVLAGAVVQSSVGVGLGLVAAPVISFLDPSLMPGAMLITVVLLPALTLIQEWRHVDWRGIAWGVPARVPGTVLGVAVVAVLEPRTLAAVVGVMVLAAVVLTMWSFRVRITPASIVTAGALSGLAGTATSIGGPPMALLYQYEDPPRVRATLAAFFLAGSTFSLGALTIGGQIETRTVVAGVVAVPLVAVGFVLGNVLRGRVSPRVLRLGMLGVVSLSAVGLLVRAVLG
ncbi:hypothetical protein GCM10007147_04230 [Nocardiopsis kunsanensis]|uniref:Probable membrane transporter protein n=1 Tax=Nocardiopsis kunsanensis TaxID=141693 RepID=A0A919CEP2_9ACTN|nr:sulfite exporter TauE/SafE family protein [Nocardiopsis kunsanensis]GHD16295.1 hypothetical protein GCM10007147_04230 [Nocardiopsis kunsanensis]